VVRLIKGDKSLRFEVYLISLTLSESVPNLKRSLHKLDFEDIQKKRMENER
jgi:hypothetical protein